MKVFQKDIKSKYVSICVQLPGKSNNLLTGDSVGIGIGKNERSICRQGLLIPFGFLIIIGSVTFPGVSGYDLSVDDSVGIEDTCTQYLGKMAE